MFREATEDTVLEIPNPVGQSGFTPMAIPKGMTVTTPSLNTLVMIS
jgi:hypothetical protein